MARILNQNTLKILKTIGLNPEISADKLFKFFEKEIPYKDFYNTLFRLSQQEQITKQTIADKIGFTITPEGKKILQRAQPERDGVWKLVIFDIPEKHKYVRAILRAKLKSLHFKKWQNSIWASPYSLEEEIETELKELAKKFFVRMIKTSDINETKDLEKMFP